MQVVVFVDAQGLIAGASTNAIPTAPTTWDGVDSLLRSVAPQVRLLAAEITDGSCRLLHAIDPTPTAGGLHAIDPTPTAPVGSVLKLYVLAALGTAVEVGNDQLDPAADPHPRVEEPAVGGPAGLPGRDPGLPAGRRYRHDLDQ